jgi:hypothetical protein
MNECKDIQKELAAYYYRELPEAESSRIEAHLETCRDCWQELNLIKKTLNGADALHPEIEAALASVDWEALPDKIADRALTQHSEKKSRIGSSFWASFLRPQLRPVYAALVIGMTVGAALMFWLLRSPQQVQLAAQDIFVPQGVMENMDVEVARRKTLDYLEKSQYLLMEFVQAEPEGAADFWKSDFAVQETRGLLSQKRYIDPQLDKYQMAKAKAICDQIEFLFLELTQLSQEISEAELEKLRTLIQERQLFLKIKIIKKELKGSEV